MGGAPATLEWGLGVAVEVGVLRTHTGQFAYHRLGLRPNGGVFGLAGGEVGEAVLFEAPDVVDSEVGCLKPAELLREWIYALNLPLMNKK